MRKARILHSGHLVISVLRKIHKTWLITRALVCRSVFSSSPPGCRSSASSRSCRAAPWCFAGWAPQCLAAASGRGPRSSRPPSAASTPHRNRANAPVWLLEVTVTSATHTQMILCDGMFSDHTAVQGWTGLELTAALECYKRFLRFLTLVIWLCDLRLCDTWMSDFPFPPTFVKIEVYNCFIIFLMNHITVNNLFSI